MGQAVLQRGGSLCVALHSLPLSTGCRVSSQNTRGSQCTCVPFSNQKVVTYHVVYYTNGTIGKYVHVYKYNIISKTT